MLFLCYVVQTEAPLMIRPLLKDMTKSELHAVMTGGFATISGSVLAGYIHYGVDIIKSLLLLQFKLLLNIHIGY